MVGGAGVCHNKHMIHKPFYISVAWFEVFTHTLHNGTTFRNRPKRPVLPRRMSSKKFKSETDYFATFKKGAK